MAGPAAVRSIMASSLAVPIGRPLGADYELVPAITHWEDRATEWSGKPDRAEVVVSVYDACSGALVDRTSVGGRSSWFALGGDRPQDVIPGLLNAYVASLF
jgi:Domain of unknown function (DUF4823)